MRSRGGERGGLGDGRHAEHFLHARRKGLRARPGGFQGRGLDENQFQSGGRGSGNKAGLAALAVGCGKRGQRFACLGPIGRAMPSAPMSLG